MEHNRHHIVQGILEGYAKVAQSFEKVASSKFIQKLLILEKTAGTKCPQKTVEPIDWPSNKVGPDTVSNPKSVYQK